MTTSNILLIYSWLFLSVNKLNSFCLWRLSIKNEHEELICEILVWPVPHRSWATRKPFWFAVVIAVISTVLALVGNILLSKKTDQEQNQRDSLQEKHLNILSDSVANLQKQIKDYEKVSATDTTKSSD